MIAEIASAKVCDLVRGQFRPLRAVDNPDLVTGILWIRECKITNSGTKATFELAGDGWQWAEQQQKKAGATFAIRQYVKFGMTATLPGTLDVAYDRHDHIMSLWFTPERTPEVVFTPHGSIDVDRKGAWASVVGAIGGIFGHSPGHMALGQAKVQGGHQLETPTGRRALDHPGSMHGPVALRARPRAQGEDGSPRRRRDDPRPRRAPARRPP